MNKKYKTFKGLSNEKNCYDHRDVIVRFTD